MKDPAGFHPDLDEEAIREWYDEILSSRHEGALADIGGRAWNHVMNTGVKEGLLETPEPAKPKEILEVARLMRGRAQRSKDRPGEPVPFRYIGRELRTGRRDDLLNRRCVELPDLFDVLQIHRNKKAHRGTVTAASLYALCGTVLTIIELASDGWVDEDKIESLRRAAEGGLAARDTSSNGELNRLRAALEESQAREKALGRELEEARKRAERKADSDLVGAVDALQATLEDGLSNVLHRIDAVNNEREGQFEGLRDTLIALRDEVSPSSSDRPPATDEDESGDGASGLTGEMARAQFRKAEERVTQYGVPYKANVFQPWIVNEALKVAADEGLDGIEDWWKLPIVVDKRRNYGEEMKQQLEIEGLQDWMMDIYRRVERRPVS